MGRYDDGQVLYISTMKLLYIFYTEMMGIVQVNRETMNHSYTRVPYEPCITVRVKHIHALSPAVRGYAHLAQSQRAVESQPLRHQHTLHVKC